MTNSEIFEAFNEMEAMRNETLYLNSWFFEDKKLTRRDEYSKIIAKYIKDLSIKCIDDNSLTRRKDIVYSNDILMYPVLIPSDMFRESILKALQDKDSMSLLIGNNPSDPRSTFMTGCITDIYEASTTHKYIDPSGMSIIIGQEVSEVNNAKMRDLLALIFTNEGDAMNAVKFLDRYIYAPKFKEMLSIYANKTVGQIMFGDTNMDLIYEGFKVRGT